jgi:ATP-dependent RNA helicase DeaD
MGKDGLAYTFVCPDQGEPLTAIENLINKTIPVFRPEGFEAYSRSEVKRVPAFRELFSTASTRSLAAAARSQPELQTTA